MRKVVLKPKNLRNISLYCPFTNEKMDNENNSFEIYEGAGNYIFSMCEDCLFFDVGNNDEICFINYSYNFISRMRNLDGN